MTREEAIEVLKDIYNYTRFDTYTTNEARNMAIKALENEPRFLVHSDGKIEQIIEPCDDAISRQALLRKMNTKTHEYGNGLGFRKEWVELINSMPPVTPKREHGEWIDCQDEGYVECPICGSATNCDGNKEDLHYCFSCGAEMR